MSDYLNGLNFKMYSYNNAIIEPYRQLILKSDNDFNKKSNYRFSMCSATKYNSIMNRIELQPSDMIKKEFDNVFFVGSSLNWYHNAIECLPRLWGYFNNKDETILINKKFLDNFKGLYNILFEFLNIKNIKFVDYNPPITGRFTNNRLFFKKLKMFASSNFESEKAFKDIKNLAVAFWQKYVNEKFDNVKPFRKVFINRTIKRKKKLTYRCGNQEDIYSYLKKFDYELLDPNEVDLPTVIKTCYEAKEVVGIHGAGLSNLVFCQPGIKFTQLSYNYKAQEEIYKTLANIMKMKYNVIYGESKDNNKLATIKERFYIKEHQLKNIV